MKRLSVEERIQATSVNYCQRLVIGAKKTSQTRRVKAVSKMLDSFDKVRLSKPMMKLNLESRDKAVTSSMSKITVENTESQANYKNDSNHRTSSYVTDSENISSIGGAQGL